MSLTTAFDDVAAAAVSGAAPIVIAVADGLGALQTLADWLDRAVPVYGPYAVERVPANDLLARLDTQEPSASVLLVPDAGSGDDKTIRARWAAWNGARERLVRPLERGAAHSIVFLITATTAPDVVGAAPQLVAVATLLTVAEDPGPAPPGVAQACAATLAELEARHGLTTAAVVAALLSGAPLDIPPHDLARWRAAAARVEPGER